MISSSKPVLDDPQLGPDDLQLGSGPVTLGRELLSLMLGSRAEPTRVKAEQQAALSRMVKHARHNVAMYGRLWADQPDTNSLPIIDKSVIRSFSLEDRMSKPPPPGSRKLMTSGSSGEPIEVFYPPDFARWQGVLKARMDLGRRIMPWHRRVGMSFSPDTRPAKGLVGVLRKRQHMVRQTLPLDELAAQVGAWRPRILRGHPHLLLELGSLLENADRPRLGTWGETLDPQTREALKQTYGSEPMDDYGATEVGAIAWQCSHCDVYHVNHEAVLVEILDQQGLPVGPGESGEVVLSGLGNFLMPFIRYRIGDTARWADGPCRCGYSLPGLSAVEGRTLDWIFAGDGRRVPPEYLWLVARLAPADAPQFVTFMKRYQIRQDLSKRLTLTMEVNQPVPQDLLDRIERSYAELLQVPVSVRVVDRLEHDSSKKFRLISSELSDGNSAG